MFCFVLLSFSKNKINEINVSSSFFFPNPKKVNPYGCSRAPFVDFPFNVTHFFPTDDQFELRWKEDPLAVELKHELAKLQFESGNNCVFILDIKHNFII